MGDFAVIAEGVTDQIVIKNVLLGLFEDKDRDDEPMIVFEQPRLDETARKGGHPPAGWTLVLKYFEQEGQILPLGVKGEGLFQLLKKLSTDESTMAELRENLRLLDWFGDIRLTSDLAPYERTLRIRDRYLAVPEGNPLEYFDQRSANEGFLFLLFYFALVISPDTPKLFAIDNIDASLNPKLCTELMRRLVALAVKHDKQILITTHNPAILDGLDLNDPDQRLYTVHRNSKGHTKARRVTAPKPVGDEPPVKLSEAFLRGLLGGLPQNF